jgi:hypothetical protein
VSCNWHQKFSIFRNISKKDLDVRLYSNENVWFISVCKKSLHCNWNSIVILCYHVFCLSMAMCSSWENHHCEKHGNTQISPNLSHKLCLIKLNQASHQGARWTSSVSMLKVPVLALIIETSAVWPWYRMSFQDICRGLDNYSRAYLWLISHDLSHGVPLMYWAQTNFKRHKLEIKSSADVSDFWPNCTLLISSLFSF